MRAVAHLIVLLVLFCFSAGTNFHTLFHNVIHQNVYELNVSATCSEQLKVFTDSLNGMDEQSMWAWKMIDATAKLQSGILEGNLANLGSFDECIGISANTTVGNILGKYCLGSLSIKSAEGLRALQENSKIHNYKNLLANTQMFAGVGGGESQLALQWAGCFPNGCTGEEMAKAYAYVVDQYLDGVLGFQFPEKMCQTENEVYPALSTPAIVTITLFSIILGLMCISTLYELYLNHTKSKPAHLIMVAFSVYTNGNKLFTINQNNADQLTCLNGLRVISMMWVVLGHQYSTTGQVFNMLDLVKWFDSLSSMYMIGATVSVDTFFLLSGLLMVYGFLKAMSKGVPFNIPLYWIHRYLRLTPALAAAVLLDATLVEYLGSGPMWPIVRSEFPENCKNYWWSTLLYIQNYTTKTGLVSWCLAQSWYLSVDMQLFILSPLILIPLWRWKEGGMVILFGAILVSIAIPFGMAWEYNLEFIFLNPLNIDPLPFMSKYYIKTHTRAAPWLIGIFLGYLIFHVKKRKTAIKLNKIIVLFLWIASLSVLITCVFGGHSTLRGDEYQKWPQVSYVVFVRPAWAIALSWLIFACVTGYGGPINWFLSFPAYQVLARLTYSVYLLHLSIAYVKVMNSRLPIYFSDYEQMYLFWGLTMFSCALSVVWVLAFESPMIVIEKVLFGRTDKPKPKANKSIEELEAEKC